MTSTDNKILEMIERLKQLKVIRFDSDFCRDIGIKKQNLSVIKSNPNCSFTVEQIHAICKVYNVNANWIFDIEKNIFRTSKTSIKSKV